jgi:hypothetical protein
VLGQRAAGHPGIGDDDVRNAVAGEEVGRGARERGRVADVANVRGDTPLRQRAGQSIELRLPAREQADDGAGGRVVPRERGADAAARAGDEDVQVLGRSLRALAMS